MLKVKALLTLLFLFSHLMLVVGETNPLNQPGSLVPNATDNEEDSTSSVTKKALFTIVYPLSFDGANSRLTNYYFALALLGNYSLSTQGFSFAGLININNANSYGFQLSGLLNYNMNGGFKGFQAAALFNTLNGYVEGVQVAALFNYAHEAYGMQLSTLFNIAKLNNGAQITALVNLSSDTVGLQLSTLFNRTKHLRGVQLGLVNVASEVDGIQLGLINLAGKNSYRAFNIIFSDLLESELVFKMGTSWLYTTFHLGVQSQEEIVLALGLGLGSTLPLMPSMAISTELSFLSLNKVQKTFQTTNIAYRLALGLNHYFLDQRLSFNWAVPLYLTSTALDRNETFHRYSFGDWVVGSNRLNMWIGLKVGIGYYL